MTISKESFEVAFHATAVEMSRLLFAEIKWKKLPAERKSSWCDTLCKSIVALNELAEAIGVRVVDIYPEIVKRYTELFEVLSS